MYNNCTLSFLVVCLVPVLGSGSPSWEELGHSHKYGQWCTVVFIVVYVCSPPIYLFKQEDTGYIVNTISSWFKGGLPKRNFTVQSKAMPNKTIVLYKSSSITL